MANKKWHKKVVRLRHPAEAQPVPIVADAAIATVVVGDGRMIPLLILDTSKRPDIEDMVKAHHRLEGQGDVSTQWGRPNTFFENGIVELLLTFEKPSHCVVRLQMDVGKYGGLVDQIIRSQGLYIQPGRPGDRLGTTFHNPRILAEVPSREFEPEWNRLFRKAIRKRFQTEHGMARGAAKEATEEFIAKWRSTTSQRMNGTLEDEAE